METKSTHNKSDCIFCKIINGEVPSYKVYENNNILAFLNIFPANIGHTLIIPKNHSQNIYEIDKDTLSHITIESQNIAKKLKEKLNCDGVNIIQNNETAAGQEIFHYHLHVIPRYNNDKMKIHFESKTEPISQNQGNEILNKLNN